MLTKREKKIIDCITNFQKTAHYSPSQQEIASFTNINRTTVSLAMKSLEDKNIIARQPNKYRSVEVLKTPEELFNQ
jgi:SOS-response transcriptional repressor LexA